MISAVASATPVASAAVASASHPLSSSILPDRAAGAGAVPVYVQARIDWGNLRTPCT